MDVDLAGVFDDEDFQEEGLNGKVIILNTTTYNVWFYNIVWGNPSKKYWKFHTCGEEGGGDPDRVIFFQKKYNKISCVCCVLHFNPF